jgi:molybdopterin synthase catalytic subunit
MFKLSPEPLDAEKLKTGLLRPDAGALVVFEGWVRNHHKGRKVTKLEYEGAENLATKEFEKIRMEVVDYFDIQDVHCVHRIGTLDVGELAVWIGVTAEHRGPAFEACQCTIDQLKERLPVWKKEYYEEGDSGWVNAP